MPPKKPDASPPPLPVTVGIGSNTVTTTDPLTAFGIAVGSTAAIGLASYFGRQLINEGVPIVEDMFGEFRIPRLFYSQGRTRISLEGPREDRRRRRGGGRNVQNKTDQRPLKIRHLGEKDEHGQPLPKAEEIARLYRQGLYMPTKFLQAEAANMMMPKPGYKPETVPLPSPPAVQYVPNKLSTSLSLPGSPRMSINGLVQRASLSGGLPSAPSQVNTPQSVPSPIETNVSMRTVTPSPEKEISDVAMPSAKKVSIITEPTIIPEPVAPPHTPVPSTHEVVNPLTGLISKLTEHPSVPVTRFTPPTDSTMFDVTSILTRKVPSGPKLMNVETDLPPSKKRKTGGQSILEEERL